MNKESLDCFSPLTQDSFTETATPSLSYYRDIFQRFSKKPGALLMSSILCILILLALLVPVFSSFSSNGMDLSVINASPSWKFIFGTDDLGRDIFTRVFQGMRVAVLVALLAGLIDLILGVAIGALSANIGGKTDEFLMRLCDILNSIPYFLSVTVPIILIGPGLVPILFALSLSGWVNMARAIRGQILEIKEKEFILAAKALGLSKTKILFRHLIPNSVGSIIAALTITLPSAIFAEAFLSFLGLGLQPPTASLGTLISDGLGALRFYPWRLFFPAGILTLAMLSFNIVGDAIRDALDPRMRQ
jgi:oligopeptide transport system permease protein